jgi:flavin reductase (DIM6/NTAB) family NADH-FMN oxidoreductase RutF
VPLLDGCPDRFVGRILSRTPLGDHIGHLLEPVHAEVAPTQADDDDGIHYLAMARAEEIDPGHSA